MRARTNRNYLGGWAEVAAFGGTFALAVSLYFAERHFGVSQFWITTSLVSAMLFYAVLAAVVPRLRVRLDQAADNVYYLGLLLTLLSMAFALYDFGVAQAASGGEAGSGAAQIIANFGIALGTTIAGILLRIILQQMRVDPAEIERASRLELADAAGKVRATLSAVSQDMGLLLTEMRQRASDHHKAFEDDAQQLLASARAAVAANLQDAARGIAEAHEQAIAVVAAPTRELQALAEAVSAATERLRAIEPPPLKLASRLEKVSAALEVLADKVQHVERALAGVGSSAADVNREVQTTVSKLSDALGQTVDASGRTWFLVDTGARQLLDSLTAVGHEVDATKDRWAALESTAMQSMTQAVQLESAAHRVTEALTTVAKAITEQLTANVQEATPK